MALKIEKKQKDGVTTEYHRVIWYQVAPNDSVHIAVTSYVDEASRRGEDGEQKPYQKAKTYLADYDEGMTPERAYNWLKRHPDFTGASDC